MEKSVKSTSLYTMHLMKITAYLYLRVIFNAMTTVVILGLISLILSKNTHAQYTTEQDFNKQAIPKQKLITIPRPKPKSKPDLTVPDKTIKRIGTAHKDDGGISIKSTDAGMVPRYQPASGCLSCGIIDFVTIIDPGRGIGAAITGGVIGGTIARKIGRHGAPKHAIRGSGISGNAREYALEFNNPNHILYDVGVTLNDGTQAIFTLPNASHFHSGDKVRLIDGALVPDY